MTEYRKTFKGCFMYPDQEMRDWLKENEVTIHSPWIDGGMYGGRLFHYSSPKLTGGEVRIGTGYDSQHGFKSRELSHLDARLDKFWTGGKYHDGQEYYRQKEGQDD